MKKFLLYTVIGVLTCLPSKSQSFSNLGFENAQIICCDNQSADSALPNWQVSLNGQPPFNRQIWYNYTALDQWQVSIYDTHGNLATIGYLPPISGEYSVFIRGGRNGFDVHGFASIAQTGTIDASSHSMLFSANPGGNLEASFKGVPLPLYKLESHPTYETWGADVTPFAGQSGELKFTANFGEQSLLDDIRFSPEVVPEPSTLALLVAGGCVFGPAFRSRHGKKA